MKKISVLFLLLLPCLLFPSCANNKNITNNLSNLNQNSADLGMVTEVLASDDMPSGKVLASFTTLYNDSIKGRSNNVRLAAKSINGKIVQPGGVFSYNEAVGPTIEKRGYMEAKIFIDAKETKGFGGGVCQVSSTLYNTVEKAGLEIVERHEHSKKVYYVKPNRDAATSYGGIYFKFKNTKDFPIIIKTTALKGTLTVDVCVA